MIRTLSYIFLFLFVFISCSKHEETKVQSGRISFSVSEVLAPTKATLIKDKKQLVSGDGQLGFSVFAARYLVEHTSTHELFMQNIKVSSTDGGKSWSYDADPSTIDKNDFFFWSPGAAHKFFAVYPYYDVNHDQYDFGLVSEVNQQEHALGMNNVITGTDYDGVNQCPDILYGVEYYPEPYDVQKGRDSVVFTLKHALAAVSLRIRNASEYPVTNVTGSQLTGFYNKANVLLSDDGAIWSGLESDDTRKFSVPEIEVSIAPGTVYQPSGNDYWYTVLMIPQDFGTFAGDVKMDFSAIMDTVGKKSYSLDFKKYPVSTQAEYQYTYLPGYHYIYNINLTASNITCDVDVVDWIEDDPIHLN